MTKACVAAIAFLSLLQACKDDENKFNPLESGFITYLSFNGNLSDSSKYVTAIDSCAASSYVPGVNGEALILDGNCPNIKFDKLTFKNSQNISVAVWFKTSGNGSTWHFIRSSDFSIFTSHGTAGIGISIPETKSAKGSFELDMWTHLVGTYDGKTIKAYINGKLVASTIHKGEISAPGYLFELDGGGITTGTLSTWTGAIDELYIFDTVLDEEQVKQLHEM
jgi:hypothetical protein